MILFPPSFIKVTRDYVQFITQPLVKIEKLRVVACHVPSCRSLCQTSESTESSKSTEEFKFLLYCCLCKLRKVARGVAVFQIRTIGTAVGVLENSSTRGSVEDATSNIKDRTLLVI